MYICTVSEYMVSLLVNHFYPTLSWKTQESTPKFRAQYVNTRATEDSKASDHVMGKARVKDEWVTEGVREYQDEDRYRDSSDAMLDTHYEANLREVQESGQDEDYEHRKIERETRKDQAYRPVTEQWAHKNKRRRSLERGTHQQEATATGVRRLQKRKHELTRGEPKEPPAR